MAHVVDPKIRKLLLEAGAQPWQTGATVAQPELSSHDGKPKRARVTPDDRPVVGLSDDWEPPPPAPPPVGGLSIEPIAAEPAALANTSSRSRAGLWIAGAALVGTAGVAALRGGRR
jgi:hypothetical protein